MASETEMIRRIKKDWQSFSSALRNARQIKLTQLQTPEFMHPTCGICSVHGNEGVANYHYLPFGPAGEMIFACDHHAQRALIVGRHN